ncbi:hypothetical protein HMPREF0880_03499, partial [Yokenella regensburgei ATCC 43003]
MLSPEKNGAEPAPIYHKVCTTRQLLCSWFHSRFSCCFVVFFSSLSFLSYWFSSFVVLFSSLSFLRYWFSSSFVVLFSSLG